MSPPPAALFPPLSLRRWKLRLRRLRRRLRRADLPGPSDLVAVAALACLAGVVGTYGLQALSGDDGGWSAPAPPPERLAQRLPSGEGGSPVVALPQPAPFRLLAAPEPSVALIATRGPHHSDQQVEDRLALEAGPTATLEQALALAESTPPADLPESIRVRLPGEAPVAAVWRTPDDDPRGRVVLRAAPPEVQQGRTSATEDLAWLAGHSRDAGWPAATVTASGEPATLPLAASTGSFGLAHRRLAEGALPAAEAVRVDEFVNALTYDYAEPWGEAPVHAELEAAPHPLDPNRTLLRVGLRARAVAPDARRAAHLTFLVDSSGSMALDDKLELVKAALADLVDRLGPHDTVAIVTYAGEARTVLPPTPANRRGVIGRAVAGLDADGATAMVEGLELGYRLAAASGSPGADNLVVLCSDGDANVGTDALARVEELVETWRRRGVRLDAVGVGMGAFRADTMERLASRGGGEHFDVDTFDEARTMFVRRLLSEAEGAGTLRVEVAFDPRAVRTWALLGRPGGATTAPARAWAAAGQVVTGLFDLVLRDDARAALARVSVQGSDEDGQPREWTQAMSPQRHRRSFAQASPDFRMAAVAAAFAELLRGSAYSWEALLGAALESQRRGHAEDAELVRMIRQAAHLAGRRRVGAQDQPEITPVVQRYAGQVQYCYAEGLERDAGLAGRLDLELHVYSGQVVDVRVIANTTGDANLEACAVRKLKRWAFPRTVEASVVLPFDLAPPAT